MLGCAETFTAKQIPENFKQAYPGNSVPTSGSLISGRHRSERLNDRWYNLLPIHNHCLPASTHLSPSLHGFDKELLKRTAADLGIWARVVDPGYMV
ncbi:unnamed protein product [Onchocerca flexuosa]|uniref:Uncharacterized protein n=1 Tax=Onchocerca flexuosa TaxID=387005 RepID=A0A183HAF8_9BILA|nr:unnamed protein product [Onchocerca flexuosa]